MANLWTLLTLLITCLRRVTLINGLKSLSSMLNRNKRRNENRLKTNESSSDSFERRCFNKFSKAEKLENHHQKHILMRRSDFKKYEQCKTETLNLRIIVTNRNSLMRRSSEHLICSSTCNESKISSWISELRMLGFDRLLLICIKKKKTRKFNHGRKCENSMSKSCKITAIWSLPKSSRS